MKKLLLFLCALNLASISWTSAEDVKTNKKPNIVVILTDDLGFSDLSCYGSEIATPHLDQLAKKGLRFSQFYNTAKCHSSRVSLLSGQYCAQAGDTKLTSAVIIPEVLAPAGYFTAMSGKWHLDREPTDFGFHRFFGHLSGSTNYYAGDNTFCLNGKPWSVPEKDFYTTVANVDHALHFLDEARATKKPWFLYVAFNAPHAPLQPLEVDFKKYLGRYDVGWDEIRTVRLEKQKQLGLFGREITASNRPEHIPAWEKLGPAIRSWEARRMAAYAALIDRVDQEIGRLVSNLSAKGELENTIIVFLSDNGACPYDRKSSAAELDPCQASVTWSDSTGWAWARNSPFRYYKQNQYEGGISTPAIVHWPAGITRSVGSIVHSPAHLVDVLPTLAEAAGASMPQTYPGRTPAALAGISLLPILQGKEIKSRPPLHFVFETDRALRDGDWKLVSFRNQPWELYNMANDRTETQNLANQHPDITERMIGQWRDMAKYTPSGALPESSGNAKKAQNHSHPEWTDFEKKTPFNRKKKPKK
jgi:arylsulfatase A-like enzyme